MNELGYIESNIKKMQEAQKQEPYLTSLYLNDLQEYLYDKDQDKINKKVWDILELLHSRISRIESKNE